MKQLVRILTDPLGAHSRYPLSTYDMQPATTAQRVRAAQLQLRAVLRHLPQTTPRLVAADSVALRTLAWSGISVAGQAGRWLRYYHPRIVLPAQVAAPALRLAAKRKAVLAESGAALGAAYPNPAQTEVIITCKLAQADQAAELRFINLLTGKIQLVVPVEGTGTGTGRSQRVALTGLPAGQYAYQLLVEGQLVAAPQRLMLNP